LLPEAPVKTERAARLTSCRVAVEALEVSPSWALSVAPAYERLVLSFEFTTAMRPSPVAAKLVGCARYRDGSPSGHRSVRVEPREHAGPVLAQRAYSHR